MRPLTPAVLLGAAFMLAVSNGWASAQSSQDQAYGKIVKEIRISELEWTKEHIITRELASRVGEPYLEKNVEEDLRLMRDPPHARG